MSEKHPAENATALSIGGEVLTIGFQANGKTFAFTPLQTQFLVNLQKMKNVAAAAMSVAKTEPWGTQFLSSPKFRAYLSAKMQQFSDKNALTVDWWFQFGKWAAEGYREVGIVTCATCGTREEKTLWELESRRGDDLQWEEVCPLCARPLAMEKVQEPFAPTRQQILSWQELGARLIPKVERVQHQFEKSEIIFESGGTP